VEECGIVDSIAATGRREDVEAIGLRVSATGTGGVSRWHAAEVDEAKKSNPIETGVRVFTREA
jgi:hypothetical protein